MSLQAGASKPDENPTINLQFKIQQLAISGEWVHVEAALLRTEMALSGPAQTADSLLGLPTYRVLVS